jgi:hypothetical protein
MGHEFFLGAVQLHVVAAQGRAAVARDKACSVQPRCPVQPLLIQRQAHQRLNACEKSTPLVQPVFVVQHDFTVLHGSLCP